LKYLCKSYERNKKTKKNKKRKQHKKKRKKGRGQPTWADPGPKPTEPAQERNQTGIPSSSLSLAARWTPPVGFVFSPEFLSSLSGYWKRPEITLPLNPPLTLPVSSPATPINCPNTPPPSPFRPPARDASKTEESLVGLPRVCKHPRRNSATLVSPSPSLFSYPHLLYLAHLLELTSCVIVHPDTDEDPHPKLLPPTLSPVTPPPRLWT
jgi:hypothetical protein